MSQGCGTCSTSACCPYAASACHDQCSASCSTRRGTGSRAQLQQAAASCWGLQGAGGKAGKAKSSVTGGYKPLLCRPRTLLTTEANPATKTASTRGLTEGWRPSRVPTRLRWGAASAALAGGSSKKSGRRQMPCSHTQNASSLSPMGTATSVGWPPGSPVWSPAPSAPCPPGPGCRAVSGKQPAPFVLPAAVDALPAVWPSGWRRLLAELAPAEESACSASTRGPRITPARRSMPSAAALRC